MWRRTWNGVAAVRLMAAPRDTLGIRQPEKEEAQRRMFRLAEDDRAHAQAAASWSLQSELGLYPGLRRLQSGTHAKSEHCSSGVSRGQSVSRVASS